jgi:hypothetical protein
MIHSMTMVMVLNHNDLRSISKLFFSHFPDDDDDDEDDAVATGNQAPGATSGTSGSSGDDDDGKMVINFW